MYGAAAGLFIRWLPFLDEGMDDPLVFSGLFGPGGKSLRKELARCLKIGLCVECSDYPEDDGEVKKCETCFSEVCLACWETSRHRTGTCLEFVRNTM